MIHMEAAASERDAIAAIVEIIRDQKALEKYHRSKRASVNTLQDSMEYAYHKIIKVVRPFMEDEG